jgi:TIR domain
MDRLGLNLDDTRPGRFSPGGSSARIFISYSRKDGGSFSADSREKLLGQQLSVWQDVVSLEGGRDWWSQIEEALKSKALEHFVLLVTSEALEIDASRSGDGSARS